MDRGINIGLIHTVQFLDYRSLQTRNQAMDFLYGASNGSAPVVPK